MSYAQRVVKGYLQNRGNVRPGGFPAASSTTPASRKIIINNPLRKYVPQNIPIKFRPANNPGRIIRPANLPGPPSRSPRLPTKAIARKLIKSIMRRHPLGIGLLLANYVLRGTNSFPGFENITPAWRFPLVTEVLPGQYAPNRFDHHPLFHPPAESLLDLADVMFPNIKYWGDYGSDPYAPFGARPYIPDIPLRFDENSPQSQRGPHPLAESLPRSTATVNRAIDYVTRPRLATEAVKLPAEVFLSPFLGVGPSLGVRQALKPKPHSRNRPRRNDPRRNEIKMSSKFAKALSLVFDIAEIVELFAEIGKILSQPDWFSYRVGTSKRFSYNDKQARIVRKLVFFVGENIVVGMIRPKISVRNPNILLQHL